MPVAAQPVVANTLKVLQRLWFIGDRKPPVFQFVELLSVAEPLFFVHAVVILFLLVQSLIHDRFSQLAAGFAGLIQTLLELITEGHEFIDFLDDTVLFLYWR